MTTQEVKDVFEDVNGLLMIVKMSINKNDGDTYKHIVDIINKYAEAKECALEVMDLMDSRLDIEDGKDGEE